MASMIYFASCTKDNVIPAQSSNQSQQIIPIPNGDFESWTNILPQNWNTNSCPFCAPSYETYIVQQDSNSFQGAFAAKFIYNNVYAAVAENKFSISTHPNNLTAFVKCNLFGADTVFIKIKVFNNSAAVDSGQWFGIASISNYSQINIPVSQNSSQADSAIISIQGGHQIGFPASNTEFWIDNLILQ